MESSSWPESLQTNRIKAIQELTKGEKITNKLRGMIGRPEKIESDIKLVNGVTLQILGMFDNTLSILKSSDLNEIPHYPTNDVRSQSKNEQKSKDFDKKIKTMKPKKTKRGCYIRRKNSSTITHVTSNLTDDGYAWRKYGQKAILNSKHQRNYYRCSHKFEQGCQATKHVQKTDNKLSTYKITYIGLHTCNNSQKAPQIIMEDLDPIDNSTLISFGTNTLMEKNKVGNCFPSIGHIPKEGFPSLGRLKQEQVSSLDYHTPWDSILELSQVPLEPMSMITCALDCDDMVSSEVFSSASSTLGYEIDMTESHDYGDFLFGLW